MPIGAVARAFGTHRATLFRWVQRYDRQGEAGLQRSRAPGSGRPRKLAELDEKIVRPASDYGFETDLWTVGRMRTLIAESYGIQLSSPTTRCGGGCGRWG
jgi:transposase